MHVFAIGPTLDPVVNKLLGFATVSYLDHMLNTYHRRALIRCATRGEGIRDNKFSPPVPRWMGAPP
jgi:hypothetical protein